MIRAQKYRFIGHSLFYGRVSHYLPEAAQVDKPVKAGASHLLSQLAVSILGVLSKLTHVGQQGQLSAAAAYILKQPEGHLHGAGIGIVTVVQDLYPAPEATKLASSFQRLKFLQP